MDISTIINDEYRGNIPVAGGSGNSPDNAVIIRKADYYTEFQLIEDKYLDLVHRQFRQQWSLRSQHYLTHGRKTLHKVVIDTFSTRDNLLETGREEWYFDIGEWFGGAESEERRAESGERRANSGVLRGVAQISL